MWRYPPAVGVQDLELAGAPASVPADKVQLAEIGLNVPVELVVKLTEPVGVVAPVDEVSVSLAVQLVEMPTWTGEGEHWTRVEVGCGGGGGATVTKRLNEPELAA